MTDIPIRVEVSQTDQANRKLKTVERGLDDLGRGVSGIGKMFRGLGPQIAVGVAGVSAVAAVAATALSAIVSKVDEVASAIHQLGMRGGEISAVATAFERVASPDLIDRLHEASGGLIDNMELMSRASQAIRAGMMPEAEFVNWTSIITRASQDMGRNVEESMRGLTTAISGGGFEVFAQFGVNILQIRENVAALGLTMESVAGRQAALRQVMSAMNQDMGDFSNSASNYNDRWTEISNTVSNFMDEVGRSFAEDPAVIAFMGRINAAFETGLPAAENWGRAIAQFAITATERIISLAEAMVPLVAGFLRVSAVISVIVGMAFPPLLLQFESLSEALSLAANATEDLGDVITEFGATERQAVTHTQVLARETERVSVTINNAVPIFEIAKQKVDNLASSLSMSGRNAANARPDIQGYTDAVRTMGVTAQETTMDLRRMQNAQSMSDDERQRLRRAWEAADAQTSATAHTENRDAMNAEIVAQHALMNAEREGAESKRRAAEEAARGRGRGGGGDRQAEIQRGYEQKEQETFRAQLAHQEELRAVEDWRKQEEIYFLEERGRIEEEQAAARIAQIEGAEAKRREVAAQELADLQRLEEFRQEEKDSATIAFEAQQERIESTLSGMKSMAGAAKGLYGEISKAMEAMGVSTEKRKKAEGAFIIAYSSVMAILEAAQAAQAFAKQDYVAGALHIVAIAGYIAAAVAASAQLGGGSAATAPAVSYTQADTRPRQTDQSGGGGTVVNNNYSLGSHNGDLGGGLEQAIWDRRRTGRPDPIPAGIGYS